MNLLFNKSLVVEIKGTGVSVVFLCCGLITKWRLLISMTSPTKQMNPITRKSTSKFKTAKFQDSRPTHEMANRKL